jgi:hydrogenase maturation protease
MTAGGAARSRVLVAALGNPDRGDDGVGAAVAERLAGRLPAHAALLTRRGDMLALIDDWAGFDALVCVDAAAPLGAPGRIHRLDLAAEKLPPELSFASSHALGLAEAIELAHILGLAPKTIIVYAIEGACFDGGAPLSPEVASAASDVADRVAAEVRRLLASDDGPAIIAAY